jgi:hypothetical protein
MVGQHGVQQHQSFNGRADGCRLSVPAVRLPDGLIEAAVPEMKDASPTMGIRVHVSVVVIDKSGEEVLGVLTAGDTAERAVLSDHADTAVEHHGDEKAGLPIGIAARRHRSNALIECHGSISSASRSSRPRPVRLPAVLPARWLPAVRYRVKPALTLAEAWAPR